MRQCNENSEMLLIGQSIEDIAYALQCNKCSLDKIGQSVTGQLIAWDLYKGSQYIPEAKLVQLPSLLRAFKIFPILSDFLRALWFLQSGNEKSCLVVNGGPRFGILTCILNSFFPSSKQKKILLYGAYIADNKAHWKNSFGKYIEKFRKWVARRMILGASLTTVWSRKQIDLQSHFLNVPKSKFVFIPFKANHSKTAPNKFQLGGYVFSGGNSRRDYQVLFEAVRNTGIPVIVSATDPKVYAHMNIPENVVLVAAREPAFSRLMAGSQFVVIPVKGDLIRGAAEASVCNAMWHGRPVICSDNTSAFEYIEPGLNGFVTPPGDPEKLRERIKQLWSQPEKVSEMGQYAHQSVVSNFTSELFAQRLKVLGCLVSRSE